MPKLRLVIACLLVAAPSSATTVVPADFAQMARESELIVRGTVVNLRAQTTSPSRRTIETVVTVFVAETIKGTPGTQTMFRVPGGRLGRYRRVMVGAPVFSLGDEVIVFLKGQAPALAMPYGLSQGVYRISRARGAPVVTPAVTTEAGRIVRGDPARRPLDPAAFSRQVQTALAGATSPTNRRAIPRAR